MALTDVKYRDTKPRKVRQKFSDGGGLQLWIQPNSSRLWQLIYQFEGKQSQMALGPYPLVSLLDARTKRDEGKVKIRSDVDPAAEKRKSLRRSRIVRTALAGSCVPRLRAWRATSAGSASEFGVEKRARCRPRGTAPWPPGIRVKGRACR